MESGFLVVFWYSFFDCAHGFCALLVASFDNFQHCLQFVFMSRRRTLCNLLHSLLHLHLRYILFNLNLLVKVIP